MSMIHDQDSDLIFVRQLLDAPSTLDSGPLVWQSDMYYGTAAELVRNIVQAYWVRIVLSEVFHVFLVPCIKWFGGKLVWACSKQSFLKNDLGPYYLFPFWENGTLTWWWLAESQHQCLTGDMAGWSKSHELSRCVVRFTAIGCVLCTYCCICMVCVGEQCFDCCKSCNVVHSPNVNCHQWSAWFLALHVTSNFVVSMCRPHSAYKHFFCLHAMASVCWKVQIPVMHLLRLFASHPTATVM
jgi:hypothetical protein